LFGTVLPASSRPVESQREMIAIGVDDRSTSPDSFV